MRVFLLILIPIVSLGALYGFAAQVTASAALSLARSKAVRMELAAPTTLLQDQLTAERHLALLYLASPAPALQAALDQQESSTDRAVRAFERSAAPGAIASGVPAQEHQAISALRSELQVLAGLRDSVAAQSVGRSQVVNAYSSLISAGYPILTQLSDQGSDVALASQGQAVVRLGQAVQALLEESDLLASDLAARSFPAADRQQFAALVAARRALLAQTPSDLTPAYRGDYARDVGPRAAGAVAALENRVIRTPARARLPLVRPLAWNSAISSFSAGFGRAVNAIADSITAQAQSQSRSSYLRLLLVGGLGLVAIILSVLLSVMIGRGLIRQLAALRESALDLADHRLPDIMARLRRGEDVDVAAAVPPQQRAGSDEISRARRPSTRRRGLPSRRLPTRRGCARASVTSSATWPAAASPCCTGSWRCSTGWNGARASLTSSRTSSASTTSPPGCAGTPRAWSSWPASHLAVAGGTRYRSSMSCAPQSPRSRTTPESGLFRGLRQRWPALPLPT